MKLETWVNQLDVETAKKLQLAYNSASFSAMENAEVLAKHYVKKHSGTPGVRIRLRAVSNAVSDAARRDVSSRWHGAWPIVGAAAEMAVWGYSVESERVREVLTAPVRAAGYRGQG